MKENSQKPGIKVKSNYIGTVISITLVLFMLGLLGMIVLNAQKISEHVKQNIGFSLYLKDELTAGEIEALKKSLLEKDFTNRIEYINKEEAAKLLAEDLGEDFVSFLGYNPLSGSIDVYLNAAYAQEDKMIEIQQVLNKYPAVKDAVYQKDLIVEVNKNIRRISIVLLGFSTLLLIVVIALINNSIRLAIYSKRFLIKTMQLVGATGGFIRRPFVFRGILNGVISGLIAMALLSGVVWSAKRNFPDLVELQNFNHYILLFFAIIVLGILISWISTSLAVRKFLRMQSADLY